MKARTRVSLDGYLPGLTQGQVVEIIDEIQLDHTLPQGSISIDISPCRRSQPNQRPGGGRQAMFLAAKLRLPKSFSYSPGQGGHLPPIPSLHRLFFHDDTHGGGQNRLPNQPGFILANPFNLLDPKATPATGIKFK